MAGYYIGNKFKIVCGENKIKKGVCGGNIIYSGANPVTYCVDTDVMYIEEVDEGNSVLSPTTFTPTKDGWTFVGWRMDNTASSSVYNNLVMEDTSITLFAIFEQTITLSYNGNGSTSGSTASQSGTRYYNNGNVTNPTFVLNANGFTKTDYSFVKWAIGSASGTQYAVGSSVTLSADTVFYAVWKVIPTTLFARITNFNTGNVYPSTGGSYSMYEDGSKIWCHMSGSTYTVMNALRPTILDVDLTPYSKLVMTINYTDERMDYYGAPWYYSYVKVGSIVKTICSYQVDEDDDGDEYVSSGNNKGTITLTLDITSLGESDIVFYCGGGCRNGGTVDLTITSAALS